MRNKKLIIVFSWPRSGTHLLWSKMTKFTSFTVEHDLPVIPLLWHSYNNKNNFMLIPNLPNPWRDDLGFNMSQNYAFFVNSSHNWQKKNSFQSSSIILNKISKNIDYNLYLNEKSILGLFKSLIEKNRSNNLLLINRFPYTLHYRRDDILKYHSYEWTILDAINSTSILLSFCKKINISTKIICMFPTFKDFYFKRSVMQKNGIYNSTTDYISLTKFISNFYKNKDFCFIKSEKVIKLLLSKKHFRENELLESLLNLTISGEEVMNNIFSNLIFPESSSFFNKGLALKHKFKRSYQWLNDKDQYSRAPLSHSLDKTFIRLLKLNKKYKRQYLSDISFNFADRGEVG